MCILMTFGPGAMPDERHLECGCNSNPDGFGWAIVVDGDRILRGYSMLADKAMTEFLAARKTNPGGAALFHARITTHGKTNVDNCHPFDVYGRPEGARGDMLLAHNGILPSPSQPGKDDDRSDTRLFAEDQFIGNFRRLDKAKVRMRLEKYLGSENYGNKLAILTTDPFYQRNLYVFNAQLGVWIERPDTDRPDAEGAIWYSNASYSRPRYTYGESWSWPTVVGTPDHDDSDSGAVVPYRLACRVCRYALLYCSCTGSVKAHYVPEWQARTPYDKVSVPTDDPDDISSWRCGSCWTIGSIQHNAVCSYCGVMACCDMTPEACQCWGGEDNVMEALRAIAGSGTTLRQLAASAHSDDPDVS